MITVVELTLRVPLVNIIWFELSRATSKYIHRELGFVNVRGSDVALKGVELRKSNSSMYDSGMLLPIGSNYTIPGSQIDVSRNNGKHSVVMILGGKAV
jgi:hypothetical protein